MSSVCVLCCNGINMYRRVFATTTLESILLIILLFIINSICYLFNFQYSIYLYVGDSWFIFRNGYMVKLVYNSYYMSAKQKLLTEIYKYMLECDFFNINDFHWFIHYYISFNNTLVDLFYPHTLSHAQLHTRTRTAYIVLT